jgi:hypothetical protein
MGERRFNLRKALLRAAMILAWVFALGTLGALVVIAWAHWPGQGSPAHLMAADVKGQVHFGRLRRIGHVLLVAWGGLWLGNAANIARLGGGVIWALWIGLLGLFFLCTLVRAVHGWATAISPGKAAEADVAS